MFNQQKERFEEKLIDLLVGLHENTVTNQRIFGFREAMKMIFMEDEMDKIVNNAATRAEKVIRNLEEME